MATADGLPAGPEPATATGPAIVIRGLVVTYPGAARPALDGISLEIERGSLVAVIGISGAGKSTLCRCLNGVVPRLLEADVSGSVRVAGLDPFALPTRALAGVVGLVLDDPGAQLSQGTAAEEVALGLESLEVPYAEMVVRVAAALAAVGLAGLEDRVPSELSGGEQQRLVMAAVLAMRPPILVLDEPTSGLDPVGRAQAFAELRRLAADEGRTVIVVDHDLELVAEHADRVLVLDGGRLVADGTPAEVLGRPSLLRAAGLEATGVAEVALGLGAPADGPVPVTVADGIIAFGAGR